jgi:hypothetical protein
MYFFLLTSCFCNRPLIGPLSDQLFFSPLDSTSILSGTNRWGSRGSNCPCLSIISPRSNKHYVSVSALLGPPLPYIYPLHPIHIITAQTRQASFIGFRLYPLSENTSLFFCLQLTKKPLSARVPIRELESRSYPSFKLKPPDESHDSEIFSLQLFILECFPCKNTFSLLRAIFPLRYYSPLSSIIWAHLRQRGVLPATSYFSQQKPTPFRFTLSFSALHPHEVVIRDYSIVSSIQLVELEFEYNRITIDHIHQ